MTDEQYRPENLDVETVHVPNNTQGRDLMFHKDENCRHLVKSSPKEVDVGYLTKYDRPCPVCVKGGKGGNPDWDGDPNFRKNALLEADPDEVDLGT